jgi:hypothetical protein
MKIDLRDAIVRKVNVEVDSAHSLLLDVNVTQIFAGLGNEFHIFYVDYSLKLFKWKFKLIGVDHRIDLLKACLQGVRENDCLHGISLLAYVFLLPIAEDHLSVDELGIPRTR